MQGLRRAVIGVAQFASRGVPTINSISFVTSVPVNYTCRFKSSTNPAQRVLLLRLLGKNDSVVYQYSFKQLKLLSFGHNSQQLRSISSLHRLPLNKSDNDTSSIHLMGHAPLRVSNDFSYPFTLSLHSLPLPYHSHVLNYNSYISSPRGQFRHISNHARRKGQRKESRTLSTQKNEDQTSSGLENKKELEKSEETEEPKPALSLYQRFKKTYKEHGKVLVVVHLITSAAWFGGFYTAARCGIDVVPYLESWNFSEKLISPFRSGGLGDVALAYLMYKLATPARYTVTIGGTNLAIRYLRKEGKMEPVPEGDTLRQLYKEGKQDFKDRHKQRMIKIRRMRSRIPRRKNRNQHKDHR